MAAVEMPQPLPVNVKTFSQLHVQNVSPVQGGFIQSIDRITPLWTAKYQTPPLLPASAQVFQAFIDGLQGAANTFLGFDPRVAKPYAYRTYAYQSSSSNEQDFYLYCVGRNYLPAASV